VTDLSGHIAVVTGGGTGIGAAIAEGYAAAGAAVAVTGRRPEPLAAVVERIEAAGGTGLAVPADVTDLSAMERAVASVLDRFGHLDLVVANAGAAPAMGPVIETSLETWRTVVELNLTGVWITAKVTVPALVAAGGGRFLVVGSGAARANAGGLGSYSAAKAGASALTRVLAAELREARIAVNELVPGPVRTPAIAKLMGVPAEQAAAQPEDLAARLRPSGEWLKEPEDVAGLALYVAGLPVDGTTGQVFSLLGRLV
jgi:NAD(P)-dependent dehydrogenase (short-subunit alcohol dehydrogenase family)